METNLLAKVNSRVASKKVRLFMFSQYFPLKFVIGFMDGN
jgi:hypothetical protein